MLLTETQKRWLKDRFGSQVRFNEPMSRHTSLRVGGPAEAYIAPRRHEDLAALCRWCRQNALPWLIIGNGTNLLVMDNGIGSIVISLKQCYADMHHTLNKNDTVQIAAGAAVPLSSLCNYAIRHGIKGLNFALGIPGTLGGAIMMNAGTAMGYMGEVIRDVTVLTADGHIRQYDQKVLVFAYRRMTWNPDLLDAAANRPLILEGTLQLAVADEVELKNEADAILKTRAGSQPMHQPSAGSFFKNPPSGPTAGELIDQAGLKGTQVGGARISQRHANWIVNTGSASATDVIRLKDLIQTTILRRYRIDLEPEVQIVGP